MFWADIPSPCCPEIARAGSPVAKSRIKNTANAAPGKTGVPANFAALARGAVAKRQKNPPDSRSGGVCGLLSVKPCVGEYYITRIGGCEV